MRKNKIFSSLLAVAAVLCVSGQVAAQELNKVEAVDHSGGYIYFDNSVTKWNDSKIMLFIGHNSYTSVYEMKKVSNTNLYYYEMPSWGGASYCSIAGASSLWGSGNWGPDNRTNATHYTNIYENYKFNSYTSYFISPSTNTKNTNITIAYDENPNNMTVSAYSYTDGIASNEGGSISITSHSINLDNRGATIESTAKMGDDKSVVSYNAIRTAKATLTATPKENYTFAGWFNKADETTPVSTDVKYTISNVSANTSLYAKFNAVADKKLSEMIRNDYFNNGYYIKQTEIYVNDSVVSEAKKYFHNGVNYLERKTYYLGNELWMTNVGVEDQINSGYGTSEDGYLTQFKKADNSIYSEKLNERKSSINKSMEEYYITLTDIMDTTDEKWEKTGNIYSSTDKKVISEFGLFTAPCFLGFENESEYYFDFSHVEVEKMANGNLELRLYIDKETEAEGKITNEDGLFSKAMIYHISDDDKQQYYLKGTMNNWISSFNYAFHGSDSSFDTYLEVGTYEFKIHDIVGGDWYGNPGKITNTCSGWSFETGKDNCTINITTAGTYNFKLDPSTKKLTVTAK